MRGQARERLRELKRMQAVACMMRDDAEAYKQAEQAYEEERRKIFRMIAMLTDARYITVIHQRYIDGQTVACVALNMCYSEDHIKHIQREALRALDEIMEEEMEEVA